jgi:hypothetical protein
LSVAAAVEVAASFGGPAAIATRPEDEEAKA